MTTLSIPCQTREIREIRFPRRSGWRELRAAVFWSAIGLVLVSPAVLSALILLRG